MPSFDVFFSRSNCRTDHHDLPFWAHWYTALVNIKIKWIDCNSTLEVWKSVVIGAFGHTDKTFARSLGRIVLQTISFWFFLCCCKWKKLFIKKCYGNLYPFIIKRKFSFCLHKFIFCLTYKTVCDITSMFVLWAARYEPPVIWYNFSMVVSLQLW